MTTTYLFTSSACFPLARCLDHLLPSLDEGADKTPQLQSLTGPAGLRE